MARREWPLRFQCAHPGCTESVTYRYTTRRDLESSFEMKNYRGGKWKCTRHSMPDEVLGTENLETRWESVSAASEHGRVYFGHSGFVCGPGFKAWADDFPPGTRLIVTARIEMPDEDAARAALSQEPT